MLADNGRNGVSVDYLGGADLVRQVRKTSRPHCESGTVVRGETSGLARCFPGTIDKGHCGETKLATGSKVGADFGPAVFPHDYLYGRFLHDHPELDDGRRSRGDRQAIGKPQIVSIRDPGQCRWVCGFPAVGLVALSSPSAGPRSRSDCAAGPRQHPRFYFASRHRATDGRSCAGPRPEPGRFGNGQANRL